MRRTNKLQEREAAHPANNTRAAHMHHTSRTHIPLYLYDVCATHDPIESPKDIKPHRNVGTFQREYHAAMQSQYYISVLNMIFLCGLHTYWHYVFKVISEIPQSK